MRPPNNIVLKELRPREQGQHLNTLKKNYCHLVILLQQLKVIGKNSRKIKRTKWGLLSKDILIVLSIGIPVMPREKNIKSKHM